MGHPTVTHSLKTSDGVQKVSISRGMGALGYTLQRRTKDRHLISEIEHRNKTAVLLGSRVTEKIYFDRVSIGASDDLVKVTDIARAMVIQYGMSNK